MGSPAESWQPLRRLRTHEQVLEAVEEQILQGRLKPGDRLPGERDLALMLGVSRPSVREALRVLEWMGVIAAGVGTGKDAGSIVTDRVSDALTRVLRVHLALANFSLDDVVATRVSLEAVSVTEAARNASPASIKSLSAILEQMDSSDPALNPQDFNKLDSDFHVGVAVASGNRLIAEMMQALRDVVQQEMVRAFERVDDWRVLARGLQSEHSAILAAIKSGDPDIARDHMTEHISKFYRTAKARQKRRTGRAAGRSSRTPSQAHGH